MTNQKLTSQLTGEQIMQLIDRMGRFGLTPTRAALLNSNDELMKQWLSKLDEFPVCRLIHGVFNTTVDVLAAFKERCILKGIDFGKFSWVGSEQAPEFDLRDPETVVVLDATLDTLQQTFEFAWSWTADGQCSEWRDNIMLSDANKLRLLSDDRQGDVQGDGPEFRPYKLRWVRIKLNTNIGRKPIDVHYQESPGCALLFMCAEHPTRMRTLGHEKYYGFWLSGLKCTAPNGQWQNYVPYIHFNRLYQQVRLSSAADQPVDNLAVPSFRK